MSNLAYNQPTPSCPGGPEYILVGPKVIKNAKIVTPEGMVEGALVIEDGLIKDIRPDFQSDLGFDFGGDYLWPGFVEVHTDNLEKHIMPRNGTFWPCPEEALEIHDAQIVAAGITTVLDSLCVGEPGQKERGPILTYSLEALKNAAENQALRAEHLIHLRCELPAPEMGDLLETLETLPNVRLLSLMDHSPGQRQWHDLAQYCTYYAKHGLSQDQLAEEVEELLKKRQHHAPINQAKALKFAHDHGIPVASHDDTLLEHVEEAIQNRLGISEFPTTLLAAQAAHEAGLMVVMGAPNLIRGGSHSGNVSAAEVASAGFLKILSSDYVPASLVGAAWRLHDQLGWPLEKAVATISHNPAQAVGLTDRGAVIVGQRADLVRVGFNNGRPLVKEVMVKGGRVF